MKCTRHPNGSACMATPLFFCPFNMFTPRATIFLLRHRLHVVCFFLVALVVFCEWFCLGGCSMLVASCYFGKLMLNVDGTWCCWGCHLSVGVVVGMFSCAVAFTCCCHHCFCTTFCFVFFCTVALMVRWYVYNIRSKAQANAHKI